MVVGGLDPGRRLPSCSMPPPKGTLPKRFRAASKSGHDRIADLHIWSLAPVIPGAIRLGWLFRRIGRPVEQITQPKARRAWPELSHLTVEVIAAAEKH